MKHLKLFFALFAMLALGVGNAWGAESKQVTLDFTSNSWGFPSASSNKTTAEKTYTSGDYSIKLAGGGSGNGHYYNTNGYLMLGKKDATLTLPAFDFTTTKIVITGKSGASTSVKQNIYVGSTEVSTATTGAAETNTYLINSSYQAAGNVYVLKVTSAHNTQITKIEIYGEAGGSTPPTPPTTYTIKWHTAVGTTTDVTLNEGATITKPATDPAMTGYEFMGWTDQCNVATDGDGFTPLTNFGTADSDKDFYAVFAEATTSGGGAPTETTASVTIQNYASANSWANGTKYASVKIDENITASVTGSSNTGKYYTSGNEWRLYQTETAKLTISATEGKTIKTAKITYNVSNNGVLKLNNSNVSSGITSTINASSVTYNVGNSGSATNGQVKVTAIEVVYTSGSAGSTTYSNYITTCSGSTPTPAVLVSIAKTAGKTEFTEGDTFEKATITATYDDATTKDVTSLATFTGYDMNTTGTQTVNVTYEGKSTSYTITVNPKPKYTITWNNAGTITTTEVVQGEALGTLPKPADCPSGKKFMGWTAATSVNNDGSGITYIKPTDKPTANTTYYAVFAVVEGGDETPTTATVTVANYATANSWTSGTKYTTMNIDANITATANGGANTGKYYSSGSGTWRFYQNETPSLTISAAAGYEIQTVKMTYTIGNTGVLTLDGSNVSSGTVCEINAASVTFSVGNTGSATNGNVQVSAIEVVYAPASKKSDYSLDCSITVDPTWTIGVDEIAFTDKYVGFEYTETFTINASNLAEDIALAIDGSAFTVSPTSIAKDATFPQTVTVTYAPTAAGTHTATLTITSGSTLSKTIALTGSAAEATIYTLTALANINPKDKVIIVGTSGGNTYAMSNDKGTGDAPDAVEVTVADNKIATDKTNILWNIAKDGENLTLYPDGTTTTWLYCTNTNNGVRVGNNENKVFTLDASGYLKHSGTSRYLGIYNNQDWRCYTSITTNIADQTFAFYVLPNTDPSIAVNPESHDFVVALNGSASQEVEITAHNIAAPAYSTSISGDTYFTATVNAGKVTVTYAPTVVGEHAATLTITETTSSQTATVALTGKCVEAVDVATAMATVDNNVVALKPFEVVKVISAKNYVYIKDDTGASLIFDYNNAHSMGSLVEGATVTGFIGKKGAYNKNPQLTPSVDYSTLSVSGSGTAVATEITEVKAEDVNKFVVLKGVEITSNVNINTNPTFTVNGKDIVFRNQLERNFEFQADMLYDIYGFVGIYNETVQFWFLEAASAGSAIEYYTVTYEKGASDVIGNVPVDTKEYAEGEPVTLKTCELTREGYTFDGWNVTTTNGTVAVTNNQFIMPGANVTVTALWEEVKTYDQGAWVLVTDASDLAVNDDVIIAAANENYALGTEQKSNNRGTGTIVKGSNVALLESNVQIITLESGNKPSTLAFYTGSGYLYAASSDNNYLRTENELSDNSSWAIEIEESVATIEAQGENTRNLLQYNSNNNKLFSCYSSKQAPVAIYEYKPNERVITFDVNGGEAYAHTYVATTDGILIVPTEVPTHAAEGQLFDSWNDKQDGSGHTYNAGDIFSFSEHTVLYAQWTVADAYHVTYNIAGASGTTPVDANHYYGGENITLAPQGDLVNPGHIFAGWKVVDATDTEIMVTDNAFIMPQSDVTATAKWVRQTNDKWVLVTETAQLVVGEKYVIACNTHSAVAGNINTSYMNKLDAAFSDDKQLIKALAPEAIVLTLGGTTDAWTFTNESGKALGATAAKQMAWGSGTTTWLLTFDADGALTMTNTNDSYGALQYNSQNPRFTTYTSGQKDIQLYVLNPAQVVEGEKTDDEVPQYSDVTVEDGGDLSVENTDTQYGDMYINNGGSVEVDENAQLTVNNLYIQTTMGTTTSGQLNTAAENIIVNGDVFIDITLGKNGNRNQWHAFTVPFPVDAMNGVYDLNDNQLRNEVNYAIMDYHGDVRAQGKYGWKKYRGILVPGTFYLMTVDGARTTYRFKKVKDAALVAENTKSLSAYTGGGKNTDYGWNGVGNPTLMHGKVAFDAQILDPESYTYKTITASSAHFTVGTPFFIQATGDGTMTMDAETSASLAPARRAAATVDKVKVMLGNADYTDYLYVSASEDATNDYEIGKDLVKMVMTNTPIVPQIFAEAYGARLCMVNAPMTSNEATVALNLYAPAEGEYTLSVEEQACATVYLLYNGNIVWNLSMGEYPIQLSQGDNAGYSLVVRRENAPTDVENILGADEQTEKFIYNGKLYILHEGKVFDAVGNVLK